MPRSRSGETSRHLSYYDGTEFLGAMIAHARSVDAFDPAGRHLGTFKTIRAATAAINLSRNCTCIPDNCGRRDNSE